jgi:hypothetical protein
VLPGDMFTLSLKIPFSFRVIKFRGVNQQNSLANPASQREPPMFSQVCLIPIDRRRLIIRMVQQVTGIVAHEDAITIASVKGRLSLGKRCVVVFCSQFGVFVISISYCQDHSISFNIYLFIHPNQPQSEKHNLFVMVNFPFLLVKIATDLSP